MGGEGFQRNPRIPSGSAIAKIKHNIKDHKYKLFKKACHLSALNSENFGDGDELVVTFLRHDSRNKVKHT